jgi:hypothetical protein
MTMLIMSTVSLLFHYEQRRDARRDDPAAPPAGESARSRARDLCRRVVDPAHRHWEYMRSPQAHPGQWRALHTLVHRHPTPAQTNTRKEECVSAPRASSRTIQGDQLVGSRRVGLWPLACVHSQGPFECNRASAAPLTQESPPRCARGRPAVPPATYQPITWRCQSACRW